MTAAAADKTLDAWRRGVSYGAFFQPIRLTVQGLAPPTPTEPSAVPALEVDVADANAPGTPKRLKQRPKPAPSTPSRADAQQDAAGTQSDNVLVIPAFESVAIPGQQRHVALNVGGPVWAMDWLPSQTTARSEDVKPADEAPAQPKKKRGRPSARGKAKREQPEELGKENAAENVATNVDAPPHQETGKHGDGPVEWRFLALSTHPPCEVRDGQVVRPTPPDHYYDAQEGARNLIQIWAIPVPHKAGHKRALPSPRPRLVYGIEHSSGVAWEMQWSPLVSQMPNEMRARDLLGVLAVTFGDGSLRVFAVPQIPPERLQVFEASGDRASACIEALPPLVTAQLPRIVPLCVQWSPRRWNLLLTGGSDGSVALWNIEPSVASAASPEEVDADPIEPQRRFQDADTIGKQDAFDWGNGWAAVRAVSWSPFDDFIFATTGNDSLFKVWDVREPRICLRSHRIRSTWGNAIQWVNDTSIQISGDQGSVYHYDIVSGSYQKLHFHPQVDSPIWDIQLARRELMPILMSACASGSIRAAPARKMYRAPQNCVEFCRVSGRKNASVHDEYKELTVSFEISTILGSSEGMGPGIREFCERDAALHRLRLTTVRPHEFPCLLASAGHAGLVLILEMQSMLDSLIADHFQPPSKKKTGRPKKLRFPFAGVQHPVAPTKSASANGQPSGRRHLTLGAFAEVKPGRASANKKKKRKVMVATVEYHLERGADSGVEGAAEEEEEEFDDDAEESESDTSPDLDDDENSDDDRVTFSDNDVDDDAESTPPQLNPNEVRLMTEYQLDLSEEDAILLAIQMSEADQSQGGTPAAVSSVNSGAPAQSSTSENGERIAATASSAPVKGKKKAPAKRKASAKKTKPTTAVAPSPAALSTEQEQAAGAVPTSSNGAATVDANVKIEPSVGAAKKKPAAKKQAKKQKASPSKKASSGLATEHEQVMDQATAFQMITYQRGLTEEEALMEAIRLSEMETMRRSSRPKRSIAQVELGEHGGPSSTAQQSPSRRRRVEQPRKATKQSKRSPVTTAATKHTPVVDETKQASATDVPAAEAVAASNQDTSTTPGDDAAATVSTAETPPPPMSAAAEEKPDKPAPKQRKTASQPPSSRKKKAQSAGTSKPRTADPAKRKKKGKAPASGRRGRSDSLLQGVGGEILSEQEALLMALKTSEIEY